MESEYKMLKRDVQREIRKDKERWLEERCKEIDSHHLKNNTKMVYKLIKDITHERSCSQMSIKDKDGRILTEKEQVLSRIKEYTEDLYKKADGQPDSAADSELTEDEEEPDILMEEVRNGIDKLKRGKSPGSDNIPAELWKASGEAGVHMMHKICSKVWKTKAWPQQWAQAIFVPIPKSGDLQNCKNYRNVSLLSHASKVLLNIILGRMKQYSERELPEEQAGFRTGRGTRDMLVLLQQIIEKSIAMADKTLYLTFIDYTKAFDTVDHHELFHVLLRMGIPKHLVVLIQQLYRQQKAAVRWNGEMTEWFDIGQGTRQGCNISPSEFNLYAEDIMRRAAEKNDSGIVIGGRKIDNIRYADDTTLLATTEEECREYLKDLVEESLKSNMRINPTKTKIMVVNKEPITLQNDILLDGSVIKQVESFKFLGSIKSRTGECTTDIKARIANAKDKAAKLEKIWKDNNIRNGLKVTVMKSLVWSVFLYGAESWTIRKADRNRIEAFEMWCWRRLLGVSWRERRTNVSVLQELGMGRELMTRVAKLKMQYFGHVARGSAGEMALTVMEGKADGRRHRGAPRMQWLDNIKEWSGHGYQQLKAKAQDRCGFRKEISSWAVDAGQPRMRMPP
jgi:hypothetical protein